MSTLETLAGLGDQREAPKRVKPPRPSGVDVVLYNANLDPNADSMLPWLWNKLREQGLLDVYFHNHPEFGFARFVRLMSSPDVHVLLVATLNEEGKHKDVMGFATLEQLEYGRVSSGVGGFIYLREFWDHHTSDEAGKAIMQRWFSEGKLDIVMGLVADLNRPAKTYLKRLGWQQGGALPGMHHYRDRRCDTTAWFITRETHEELYGQG